MNTTSVPAAIQGMCDQYQSAVYAKDVVALMALYDPDVILFDAWDAWRHDGAAAWRTMVEAWFASLGQERVRVAFTDLFATEVPGMATVSAMVGYARVTASGEVLRALQNRMTWVLAERAGAWRIIHEHTSLPVAFDGKHGIPAP
jgi:ketosteroid isomerase-like protein